MIGSARTACVRENEDALGAVHEGVGISHARRRRAGLQLLTAIGKAHETFCPSGHLGYGVGTKSLDDGIEGGRDRRHSAKQLESVLANSQRLLPMHRIAVGVGQWAGPFIAVVIARPEERRGGKGGGRTCISRGST